MNKSIALILSLLVTSVSVGCGSSDNNSPGSAGSSGAGESGGDTNGNAGADNSAAGDSSSGATGNAGDAGSPGDTGGTSSGGSGDGAGGAPNPTNVDCKKLETCCVGLSTGSDGGPKGACEHIAGLNYGPSCVSTYSLYKCDSVIAMENQPKSSACTLGTQCTRTAYSAAADAACAGAAKGTASENCPAAGVIACCKLPGVTELCYYDGNESPITEADCTAESGTYSTTP